jgi:hypothetical protein
MEVPGRILEIRPVGGGSDIEQRGGAPFCTILEASLSAYFLD